MTKERLLRILKETGNRLQASKYFGVSETTIRKWCKQFGLPEKSKDLKKRQQGNSVQVISYADRTNSRMRSKYYRLIRHGKKKNIAIAAIARELACFVWGMMTDNIEERVA